MQPEGLPDCSLGLRPRYPRTNDREQCTPKGVPDPRTISRLNIYTPRLTTFDDTLRIKFAPKIETPRACSSLFSECYNWQAGCSNGLGRSGDKATARCTYYEPHSGPENTLLHGRFALPRPHGRAQPPNGQFRF